MKNTQYGHHPNLNQDGSSSTGRMSAKQNITAALVVGGCGNLGHKVVTQLLKLDPIPRVFVFDLNTTNNRVSVVEYYDVVITSKTQVDAALDKTRPQVIFHTASPPPALNDLPFYLKVNVEGTRTLLVSAKVSLLLVPTYVRNSNRDRNAPQKLLSTPPQLP